MRRVASFAVATLVLGAAPARAQPTAPTVAPPPPASGTQPSPGSAPPDAPPNAPIAPPGAPASPPAGPVAAPPQGAIEGRRADPVSIDEATWRARYLVARGRLVAGDFGNAAAMFADLARTAPGEVQRALATEQWALAAEWARRDVVLVRRDDATDSVSKRSGERTTDEIAILYSNAVAYGLGSGGWVATLTEPETAAGFVLPSLGLAAASVGGVFALDNVGDPLRYGVPQSIVSGLYIGLGEGITFSIWNQARADRAQEWEASGVASLIWATGTVGALAGGLVGSWRGATPGRASFVESAALWTGAVGGFAVGAFTPDKDAEFRDDNALLAGAIMLNVGAIGGIVAAGPVSPSIARVRFIDLGGVGGALVSGGIYWAAANDDVEAQPLLGIVALGSTAGLATSFLLTSGMKPDRYERPEDAREAFRTAVAPVRGGAVLELGGGF